MKTNPKSEIRNPIRCDGATARREEARIPKSEIRILWRKSFRISGLGFLSDFGFRISDFHHAR